MLVVVSLTNQIKSKGDNTSGNNKYGTRLSATSIVQDNDWRSMQNTVNRAATHLTRYRRNMINYPKTYQTNDSSKNLIDKDMEITNPILNETLIDLLSGHNMTSAEDSSLQEDNDPVPPYMQHMTLVLVILHVSVFITGLVGNSLVCLSVYRNKSLQTVTNYYIVNLAVADFLVILICLPPTVYWDLNLTWNFGLVLCKLVLYLQSISVSVSVLTLTCISIDRWYAICRPLEFTSSKYRAKVTIVLIWLMSMLIASPDVIFLTTQPIHEENNIVYMDCTYSWPESNTKMYQLCIVSLLFIGPFVLMSISYSHIVNVLWRNETQSEAMANSFHEEEEQYRRRRQTEHNLAKQEVLNESMQTFSPTQIVIDDSEVATGEHPIGLGLVSGKTCTERPCARQALDHCKSNNVSASPERKTLAMTKSRKERQDSDPSENIKPNLSAASRNQSDPTRSSICQFKSCSTQFDSAGDDLLSIRESVPSTFTNHATTVFASTLHKRHGDSRENVDNEQSGERGGAVTSIVGHASTVAATTTSCTNNLVCPIEGASDKDSDKISPLCNNSAANLLDWKQETNCRAYLGASQAASPTGTKCDEQSRQSAHAIESEGQWWVLRVGAEFDSVKISHPSTRSSNGTRNCASAQHPDEMPVLDLRPTNDITNDTVSNSFVLDFDGRRLQEASGKFIPERVTKGFCQKIMEPDDRSGTIVEANRKAELISASANDVIGPGPMAKRKPFSTAATGAVDASVATRAITRPRSLNDQELATANVVVVVGGGDGDGGCVAPSARQCINGNIKEDGKKELKRVEQKKECCRLQPLGPSRDSVLSTDTVIVDSGVVVGDGGCVSRDRGSDFLALNKISGLSRSSVIEKTTAQCCGCFPKLAKGEMKSNDKFLEDMATTKRYRKNLANYAAMRNKCQAAKAAADQQVKHRGARSSTTSAAKQTMADTSICESGRHEEATGNGDSKILLGDHSTNNKRNLSENSTSFNEQQPCSNAMQSSNNDSPNPSTNHLNNLGNPTQNRFYKLIESRKKAAKMLIVIVIMFGLCYLPVHFLNILRYTIGLPQNDITTIASLVSHWLCYFNSAVNPLIYNLMSGVLEDSNDGDEKLSE